MKIAMITSFPPIKCGIGDYSFNLVRELRALGHEVFVVTHKDNKKFQKDVFPVIDKNDIDSFKIAVEVIKQINPEIVHIQHEWGLFDKESYNTLVVGLIAKLQEMEIPIIITPHTPLFTLEEGIKNRKYLPQTKAPKKMVYELIVKNCHVIALTEMQKREILEIDEKAKVYSMSLPVAKTRRTKDAKELLGLKGKTVVSMLGFMNEGKGFDRIIKMWPEIAEKNKNSFLIVAGGVRDKKIQEYKEYFEKIKKMVKECPAKNSILFKGKILSEEEFKTYMSATDIAVLPYRIASQSGILSNFFGYGVSFTVQDIGGLKEEVEKSRAGIVCRKDEEFKDAVCTLLKDSKQRKYYQANSEAYARKNSFEKCAEKTAEIYNYVLRKEKPFRFAEEVMQKVLESFEGMNKKEPVFSEAFFSK